MNLILRTFRNVIYLCFQYNFPHPPADSPGFNINFESAPFKFTREYMEILGGVDSDAFKLFQDLFLRGFLALQKHIDGITSIVQVSACVDS